MNTEFNEDSVVSYNTLRIGMISTAFFILINVLSAFSITEPNENGSSLGFSEVIKVVIYYFLYASIWYAMREVLVKGLGLHFMYNTTTWLLRLVIISGLFTLALNTFKHENFILLFFVIGLAMLGVFINFMIRIMRLDVNTQPVLRHLRHFVIAILVLIVAIMIKELIVFRYRIDIKVVSDVFFAVPFVFVFLLSN